MQKLKSRSEIDINWELILTTHSVSPYENLLYSTKCIFRQYGYWMFFTFILLLALWIVLGNSLVIAFVISKNQTNLGYVRASLAIADMLTGKLESGDYYCVQSYILDKRCETGRNCESSPISLDCFIWTLLSVMKYLVAVA